MTARALGTVPLPQLIDARIQLHWAAQLAAVVGNHLLPAQLDDSHSNLEWLGARDTGEHGTCHAPLDGDCSPKASLGGTNPPPISGSKHRQAARNIHHPLPSPRLLADRGSLAGGLTTQAPPLRSALCIADLELLLLDETGRTLDRLKLGDRTLTEGIAWLDRTLTRLGAKAPGKPVALRRYDGMPSHPVGTGEASFDAPRDALLELSRWYAHADQVLRTIASNRSNSSPVRCWPHHFDIATLLTMAGSGESARTIGIGMSPGDAQHAEPYWSVNAWPFPNEAELPALAAGSWHAEGWSGAMLSGSELVAAGDAAAQDALLSRFLESAMAASQALLEASGT